MVHESLLDFPLAARVRGAQEVEEVRVFEHLSGQVRFRGREGGGEIGDGLALALVETRTSLSPATTGVPLPPPRVCHSTLPVFGSTAYTARESLHTRYVPPLMRHKAADADSPRTLPAAHSSLPGWAAS